MESSANASKAKRLSVVSPENDGSKNTTIQLDGELVLRDMMDNVCQYFKMHELCHVAQVCKSWNKEALREISKRYVLECTILPYLHSKELMDSSFHVSKILHHKPYVTFLFPGTNREVGDVLDEVDLEYDIYKTYRKQFPNMLIVVRVLESMIDTNLIHSCPVIFNNTVMEQYTPSGILRLSLPMNKRLSIKHSCIYESEFLQNRTAVLDNMIQELIPDCSDTKSTLILFVANPDLTFTYRDSTLTSMLNTIKYRFAQKSYTLWGLVTPYNKIFASNNHISADNNTEVEARFVSLNLTGPNLESWSTVISVNITKREMEQRLCDFKNRIRLKQCSVGLITAPSIINEPGDSVCYSDSRELVNNVKKIFPEILFLGTFCEDEDFYFGIDAMNDETNELMSHEIISIMVFTYE